MQGFWNERARENPWYFVDNRQDYSRPDLERFWSEGARDLAYMFDVLGLELRGDETVVDLGCGVGRLSRALAASAGQVIGMDVSEEMLARAEQHNGHLENVRWIHGDGRTLRPLDDASVDACVSVVVFQHIPDPDTTLGYVREMGRVLRPGGWAAFQVSTDPAVHAPRRRSWRERLRVLAGRSPRGQEDPRWRGSRVDLDDVRRAATDGGMTVARVAAPTPQFSLVLAHRAGG
jgi:ubiquinone/menaquinone biosynthesis C-methylase UbiE